jgi:hypothetical protein
MKKELKTAVVFCTTSMFVSSAFASFGLEDKLDVSVDTGVRYTDNRDSSEYNEISTMDYNLGLNFDGLLNWGMSELSYFAQPSLRYREKPSASENYTKLLGTVGFDFRHRFSEVLTMSLDDRFTYTDDQSVDRPGTGEQVRGDESYILNVADFDVDYFLSRETKLNAGLNNTIKKYNEKAVADRSDRVKTGVDASIAHQFSTTAAWEGIIGYTAYDLASKGLPQKRDFDSFLAAVGLYNNFTAQFTAGIKAGVQYQNYKDSEIDSNTSPYASIWGKGYTIPSFRLNGAVTHGVTDAADYPFTSIEYSRVSLTINWELTKKLILNGLGSYEYQDYDSSSSEDLPPNFFPKGRRTGSKEIGVAQIGLSYKIREACDISISQRYEDVDSQVTESYTKNDTMLTLSYLF